MKYNVIEIEENQIVSFNGNFYKWEKYNEIDTLVKFCPAKNTSNLWQQQLVGIDKVNAKGDVKKKES